MKPENIQDIYELSPVQQGILFHSLYEPDLRLYFIQFSYRLQGRLNLAAFAQAWQYVATCHTALRTSFYWEDIDKPLQVVHCHVNIPLDQLDWQDSPPAEQAQRLASFVEGDRKRGFDFSQAPLMRLTLIHLAEDSYQLIWSKHHLILDGWSSALVMKDFVECYQALCQGQAVPHLAGSCFGDYIAWLQQQDLTAAETYWRQELNGINAPTPLTHLDVTPIAGQEEQYDEQQIKLSATTTTALQSLARQHQLTLNTLIQGAWAVLLSRYSCHTQVVYGCTVSARPIDLAGAEWMVGTFVNTLPVRVRVDAEQMLLPWLQQLQAQQVEMRQYEYSPLVKIQGWSEIPRGLPLFESIVVFENYPVDRILKEWKGEVEIQSSSDFYKTNYPLTIVAYPGSELVIGISYDRRRFDITTTNSILRHFEQWLQSIVTNPNICLKDVSFLSTRGQQISIRLEKEATFDFSLCSSSHLV
jgi:hypothetical protein